MTHEIEVLYLIRGNYVSRKFMEIPSDKSFAMMEATAKKMRAEKKETMIILRFKKDEDYYLINSIRT